MRIQDVPVPRLQASMFSKGSLTEVGTTCTKYHKLACLHMLLADSPECNPAYACPHPWEHCPAKTLLENPTSRYFGAHICATPTWICPHLAQTTPTLLHSSPNCHTSLLLLTGVHHNLQQGFSCSGQGAAAVYTFLAVPLSCSYLRWLACFHLAIGL